MTIDGDWDQLFSVLNLFYLQMRECEHFPDHLHLIRVLISLHHQTNKYGVVPETKKKIADVAQPPDVPTINIFAAQSTVLLLFGRRKQVFHWIGRARLVIIYAIQRCQSENCNQRNSENSCSISRTPKPFASDLAPFAMHLAFFIILLLSLTCSERDLFFVSILFS